jgi:hypothetical protein
MRLPQSPASRDSNRVQQANPETLADIFGDVAWSPDGLG